MTALLLPIAAHVLTGEVLTLAIPLGVLVVVAVWYAVGVRRDSGSGGGTSSGES